ncbi:glycosyltransferase family 2 protein [Nocardia panacis]|uniref:Glycosyltransferase family 2 protein n=1 Tax=Nocardia panacis TaxID=2340916 RepID=A0A3A4JTU4_9NOCA|nr:glycosyltransferase family 2 protein [Nocardia panacis]RJO73426.1 glycosyltransferase family 2 protein [Nocardia panacis]
MELTAAMPTSAPPHFDSALWIGEFDLAAPPADHYLLRAPQGYRRARLLVRQARVPLGFVTVDITDGAVHRDSIEAAAAGLVAAAPHRAPLRPHPPVTVAICTRDRPEMLRVALDSVLAIDYPDLRVIVVDNAAATEATRAHLAERADPRVRLVVERRPGLSRARNAAILAAETEIVAFTDDDVLVDRHWITALVAGFERGTKVRCVCGIVPSGEISTPAQAYFDRRVGWARALAPRVFGLDRRPADQPLFPFQVGRFGTGANFAIQRSIVLKLGGFDERLGAGSPTQGGEDLDMFFRVLLDNGHLAYQPAAIVWHRHRADNAALLTQAHGYGLGLGAWLTTLALHPRTLGLALGAGLRGPRRLFGLARAMARSCDPDDDLKALLPNNIRSTELRAIARGPFAYRSAAREGRHRRPLG